MIPVSPVIAGGEAVEVVYAKDQPEYTPLPTFRTDNVVLSRWRLDDTERAWLLAGNDLFITQITFGGALQPIMPFLATDEMALEIVTDVERKI